MVSTHPYSKSGQQPMMTRAGIVKMIPAAIEAAAEGTGLHDVVFQDVAATKSTQHRHSVDTDRIQRPRGSRSFVTSEVRLLSARNVSLVVVIVLVGVFGADTLGPRGGPWYISKR
jgi:hypothetical protein